MVKISQQGVKPPAVLRNLASPAQDHRPAVEIKVQGGKKKKGKKVTRLGEQLGKYRSLHPFTGLGCAVKERRVL